jgi:hypothetical protein
MYRKYHAGTWSPTYNITNNWGMGVFGSMDPDLEVDDDGNTLHVVWYEENGEDDQCSEEEACDKPSR